MPKLPKKLSCLREEIIHCRLCPRLVAFREAVPPHPSYKDQIYWRKPLPGFGDPNAWLLITGLAPAAHGGNRTGRVFTGDGSGKFLISALYEEGFANQPNSDSIDDGLQLFGTYITAAVKCVPPDNKPSKEEIITCHRYYQRELELLTNVTHVLALGKLAFDAFLLYAKMRGFNVRGCKFFHGACYRWEGLPTLFASYHPTPRNTNTGTLTKEMFRELLQGIRTLA